MIFNMDYLDPISEYFKLPEVQLRPEILPSEAAEFFISSLSPIFTSFHRIGGDSLSDEEQTRLLLRLILFGIAQEK